MNSFFGNPSFASQRHLFYFASRFQWFPEFGRCQELHKLLIHMRWRHLIMNHSYFTILALRIFIFITIQFHKVKAFRSICISIMSNYFIIFQLKKYMKKKIHNFIFFFILPHFCSLSKFFTIAFDTVPVKCEQSQCVYYLCVCCAHYETNSSSFY